MRTQSMCSLWRDPIIVFTVTDWSPWWFVKKGLFIFIFIFFLYLCWRCHLRSSHCTRKRFHSLPAHVRVSEAHIHVDYMGHQRTTPVWQAGRLCTDFLWKLIFAPLYLECPLSLMRYGSRRMKWQRVEFCRRVRGGALSLQMFPDRWEAPLSTGCPDILGTRLYDAG